MLDELNEGALLTTIRKRYSENKIYTSIGSSILISLNPYMKLPIYKVEKALECKNYVSNLQTKDLNESSIPDPHLFMMTEKAYQDWIRDNKSQSIIVTGESGAGKTEATKIILSYLAKWKNDFTWMDAQKDLSDLSHYCDNETSLEKQILDSNPLLEAFGNAKTVMNNNSSRFGKFIKVNIDPITKNIDGASIKSYLLEKSRIVHQSSKERNFHIFYYMFLDKNIIEQYELEPIDSYTYLKNSCIDGVSKEDDEREYYNLKDCLKVLGFTDDKFKEITDLIIGILNLGNIEFDETYIKGKGDEASINENTRKYLKKASVCLGVDPDVIEKALISDGKISEDNSITKVGK